jgi:hypothetical protein
MSGDTLSQIRTPDRNIVPRHEPRSSVGHVASVVIVAWLDRRVTRTADIGRVAVCGQTRIKFNLAPKVRVVGRVWTRRHGVEFEDLRDQRVKGYQKSPLLPAAGRGETTRHQIPAKVLRVYPSSPW